MPKVGTAYVSIRARLDKLEKDLADAKGLTTKRANETATAVSNAFKGIIAYFGVREITRFGEAIFDTGREIARLDKSFKEITGSTGSANKEFSFLRKVADDLGQNFYDLAGTYKSLLAASKNTVLEGEATRNIFIGITKAGASLGLTSDQLTGALNAVQQMMSKGKVQAEELRGQLGERLPGAFNLAAEAMGITTQQLNKMLDDGRVLASDLLPKLGDLLQKRYSGAADGATIASNKLQEAWIEVKKTIGDSGFMDLAVESMQDLSKTLRDKEFLDAVNALSQLFIAAAKVGKVTIEIIGGAYSKTIGEMAERIYAAGKVGDQTGQRFKIEMPSETTGGVGAPSPTDLSGTQLKEYEAQLDALQKAIDESQKNLSDTIGYDLDSGFDIISAARQNAEAEALELRKQGLMDYWEFEFKGWSDNTERLIELDNLKAQNQKDQARNAVQQVGQALQLAGQQSESAFKAYKAYKIAETTITGIAAAVEAWNQGMKINYYVAAAYAASSLAWTTAQIVAMGGSSYGGGNPGSPVGAYEANPLTGGPETDSDKGQLVININGDVLDPQAFADVMVERINDAADRDVFINYARDTR